MGRHAVYHTPSIGTFQAKLAGLGDQEGGSFAACWNRAGGRGWSLAGATAGLLGLRLSLRQPSLSWRRRRSATLQEPGGRYRWTFRAAPFSPPALSFLAPAPISDPCANGRCYGLWALLRFLEFTSLSWCRADRRPCRSRAGATAGLLGLRLSLRQPSLSWAARIGDLPGQEPGGRYRWTFRAAPFSPPALSFLVSAPRSRSPFSPPALSFLAPAPRSRSPFSPPALSFLAPAPRSRSPFSPPALSFLVPAPRSRSPFSPPALSFLVPAPRSWRRVLAFDFANPSANFPPRESVKRGRSWPPG